MRKPHWAAATRFIAVLLAWQCRMKALRKLEGRTYLHIQCHTGTSLWTAAFLSGRIQLIDFTCDWTEHFEM